MSTAETVWQRGSFSTTLENIPGPELIEHMDDTCLGTPGGLQYYHRSGNEKLQRMRNGYFLILRRSGKLLGSVGYVMRHSYSGGRIQKTWLVRYFSIKAPLRSDSLKKKKNKSRPLADRSISLLKDLANQYHNNPEKLIDPKIEKVPKAILYAFVEQKNERSRNFIEISGFSKTGEVESFIFSRLRKRKHKAIRKIKTSEIPEMKKLLREFYANHAFYFDEYLFLNEDYYYLKKDGEIIAGLQANDEYWEIVSLGNAFLDRIVRILTRIPSVAKRFRLEKMRFLGIEGIYFRKNYEKEFYDLLEGVLALKQHYLALLMLDTRSPEFGLFAEHKKRGPAFSILGSFKADIYTKFFSFPDKEKVETINRPVYLSIYDST